MTTAKKSPLYLRSANPDPEKPFSGDLFGRQKLAERLTSHFDRLPDGAVLAIDAPWGAGKTWFGRNWHAQLANAGYRTAYIDCFERDYIEDPFVMIAGELLQLAKLEESPHRRKLLDAGKKLGVALLPSATKFALNTIGHLALGNAEFGEDLIKGLTSLQESSASALEKLVAKRLESYENDKKSIEAFRSALQELAKDGKPIVIFLDELDRCRPDFAIRTIERMKHFFEAPNVVFVLLMNREQLVAAIQGIYGSSIDAESYLGKFIQLSLTLPKQTSHEMYEPDDNQTHCKATLVRYGFPPTDATQTFATIMGLTGTLFKFSLRDIERAVVLFSLAQPLHASVSHVTWPIALKLTRPDLFSHLMANNQAAHQEAYTLVKEMQAASPPLANALEIFAGLHKSGATDFVEPLSDDASRDLGSLRRFRGPKEITAWLFSCVDLDIAR